MSVAPVSDEHQAAMRAFVPLLNVTGAPVVNDDSAAQRRRTGVGAENVTLVRACQKTKGESSLSNYHTT